MEKSNRKLIFTLILLLSVILISCNGSEQGKFNADNSIEFDTIRIDERYHLDDDVTGPYCDININFIFPASSEKYEIENLQQFFVSSVFGTSFDEMQPEAAINAYVGSYFENYSRDAGTYQLNTEEISEMNALLPDIDISGNLNGNEDVFYSYYESLSDTIVYNQHDILSFQVKQANSKGGVSSQYISYSNYVINLQSGKQITENDIFRAGYDRALQNFIVTSLLDQNKVKTIEELEDIGFYGIREILPNGNFLLNDKGIIYTYNKGEYSAIQLSAPEVFIPYSAIRSLLRDNTIASNLANL